MTTAEKIKKYCFVGVAGQECISVDQALAFLTEHNKELIESVDALIRHKKKALESGRLTAAALSGVNLSIATLYEIRGMLT